MKIVRSNEDAVLQLRPFGLFLYYGQCKSRDNQGAFKACVAVSRRIGEDGGGGGAVEGGRLVQIMY